MRKFTLFFLPILLIVLGCEYDLDNENFRTVQPPDEYHPFDLNLVSEQDTIKLFKNTQFTYSLNTYGLKIWEGKFSLGDQEWQMNSQDGTFRVSPGDFSPGFDTLHAIFYTNSGTGSIADIAGGEGYIIEKNWLVVIDNRPANPITPAKSITGDGYLKISWPKCDQYNFHSYEVTSSEWLNKMVYDADSCFYIDSSYVGGEIYFRINLRVIADDDQHAWGESFYIEDPEPVMYFENIGLDSIRIFWDRVKYACRYKLIRTDLNPDTTLVYSSSDTSVVAVQPGFGDNAQFSLYTEPYHMNSSNTSYMLSDHQYYSLGDDLVVNWPRYGYNHIDKTVYTNNYNTMEAYDITTMTKLHTNSIIDLDYRGLFSCATNSTRTAALSTEHIYVFEDNNLINPSVIPYEGGADYFYLTDNDMVAIAKPNRLEMVGISEKRTLATHIIDDYPVYSKWACFSTSRDASYTGIVTYNGIKIFQYADTLFNEVYGDSRSYRSILFDINDPGKVMVTYTDNNLLEIRSVPDFGLVKSITLPTKAQVFRNIDPESGYLLLTDYNFLYILDLESSAIVLKIRSDDSIPQLYGGRLFSYSGQTVDISNYLPQ